GDCCYRKIEGRIVALSKTLMVTRRRCQMLGAEKSAGVSWASVRDRLPFAGHECALICRNSKSNCLTRAIGCRLHGKWEIQDGSLMNCDVRAWLKLPSLQYLNGLCEKP